MTILHLQVSYPDFKILDTIDPNQVDQNSTDIMNKVNEVIDAFNQLNGTGGITTASIADNAVTTSKIQDGAVTANKLDSALLDSAVINTHRLMTPLDHPDGSVITSKLADQSVTTAKIADGNVTNAKLQNVGQANGLATLGADGKVPPTQLPPMTTNLLTNSLSWV